MLTILHNNNYYLTKSNINLTLPEHLYLSVILTYIDLIYSSRIEKKSSKLMKKMCSVYCLN